MNGVKINYKSELDKFIKELDKHDQKIRQRASVFAMRKLREAAPVKTGNLRSSLKTKHWRRSTGVGFTRPKGAHAWLVENGHDIIRNGQKVGRVEGKPFFYKTWNELIPQMQKIMKEPLP